MVQPEFSYSEPDGSGDGEPDRNICPSCRADLRAVGVVEDEPVWLRYWWSPDAAGAWRPNIHPEPGERVGDFSSEWSCGKCKGRIAFPPTLEEAARYGG